MTLQGRELVQKLEELGVAGSEAVCGSDIDWMFMGPDSDPLSAFCTWFCDNVNSADVLSQEELQEYRELEESGEVLHGPQLEAMAGCLSSLDSSSGLAAGGAGVLNSEEDEQAVQEELSKLQQQLKTLSVRKDQLSMQQLRAASELGELEESVMLEESSMKKHQLSAMAAAEQHAAAIAKLAGITDRLAHLMQGVATDGSGFLMSTDLSAWLQEEKKYSEAVKQLIKKQFPQGCCSVLSGGSSSEHQLLTTGGGVVSVTGEADMALVTGPGEAAYKQHAADLTRLHKLVQSCERDRVEEEVRASRHKAEAEEAGNALDKVKRGHYAAAPQHNIQKETDNQANCLLLLREETERQESVVSQLVQQTAQQVTTATITGDYNTKQLRQQYYTSKQRQVLELLMEQLSRVDYLSLLLQLEGETMKATLQQLLESAALLLLQQHRAQQRNEYLTGLSHELEVDRALGRLPAHLVTLGKLVDVATESRDGSANSASSGGISTSLASYMTASTDNCNQTESAGLVKGLEKLLEEEETAQQQVASLQHPHTHVLDKLSRKCSLLEDCLSDTGSSGRLPGTLPGSWLPPQLLDRITDAQSQAYQLRKAMMELLLQYENKKRILNTQPGLAERLASWK